MKKTGFYIIKDQFFEDMPDPYLKRNKAERYVDIGKFEERQIKFRMSFAKLLLCNHVRRDAVSILEWGVRTFSWTG